MENGFLNILKMPGLTSSDVVFRIRKMLPRGVKVGHGGTLDPDAAGVLPVCVGRATRLFDYMIDKEKVYLTELTLGAVTDTQDASGEILTSSVVTATPADVCAVLPKFIGDILQTPPAYSAIKRDGQRMYQLARAGIDTPLDPRPVRISAVEYVCQSSPNAFMLRIRCGKGVYIRTLCHDIGAMLGCGGYMSFLLRTRAGVFDISEGLLIDHLTPSNLREHLCALDAPVVNLPAVHLGASARRDVINGKPIPWDVPPGPVRLYVGGDFAGIGMGEADGFIHIKAMLLEVDHGTAR